MEPNNEPAILPDYARINIVNEQQVEFWSRHLNVTEKQLKHAVFKCGPIVKEVREYLASHYFSKP